MNRYSRCCIQNVVFIFPQSRKLVLCHQVSKRINIRMLASVFLISHFLDFGTYTNSSLYIYFSGPGSNCKYMFPQHNLLLLFFVLQIKKVKAATIKKKTDAITSVFLHFLLIFSGKTFLQNVFGRVFLYYLKYVSDLINFCHTIRLVPRVLIDSHLIFCSSK